MRNKSGKIIAAILVLLLTASTYSQEEDKDLQEQLLTIGADAAPRYMLPFMEIIGTGLNNGWYKSSKKISMFGLPVGISAASFALTGGKVTESMKTFDFSGSLYIRGIVESQIEEEFAFLSQDMKDSILEAFPETVEFEKNNVPTIFGATEPESLTIAELLEEYPEAYETIEQINPELAASGLPLPFIGIIPTDYWAALPNINFITVGLTKLPIIDNIQIGLSYIPEFEDEVEHLGTVKFNYLSYKIQHEFTPFLPVLNKFGFLHTSWFFASNNISLDVDNVLMDLNCWNAMLHTSVDFKFLLVLGIGAYVGAGFESNSMDIEVKKLSGLPGLPGFKLSMEPKRSPKTQIGARLSVLNFDVWGEYNIGDLNSYTIGVTLLSLDGL